MPVVIASRVGQVDIGAVFPPVPPFLGALLAVFPRIAYVPVLSFGPLRWSGP
jgi:C4-dicarboxylate transporter DctM subunit